MGMSWWGRNCREGGLGSSSGWEWVVGGEHNMEGVGEQWGVNVDM